MGLEWALLVETIEGQSMGRRDGDVDKEGGCGTWNLSSTKMKCDGGMKTGECFYRG